MKAIVNNSTCRIVSREKLTRGTVGKTMEAEFSDDWAGLAITATFEAGDIKKDWIYTEDPITIPHEVLATAGVSVMLGFHGALEDGTIVKRTEKEWLNNVSETLDPAGAESSEPTPDWTAQVQNIATAAKEVADSVRNDADTGKFNGKAGEAGGWYTPAVTQPDANTMRMSFTPSKEGMPAVEPTDITLPGGTVEVDDTLTKSGKAADAKVVGNRLSSLSEEIANLPSSGGSGLSSAERSTLIAVVNAIGAFNVTNGQELIDNFNTAWGNVAEDIPATGITLSAVSLNFTAGTSQTLSATVEPSDSTDTVVWSSSNPAVATVLNGVVTPVANGDCVITATAGSVSASCAVNVAFAEEVVYYTITNNLTNCTSDNAAASIIEGGSYTANLTAADGYTLDGAAVSVVVNGEDVTDTVYADGVITIQSVTGDVVITISAAEVSSGGSDDIVMLSSITGDGASYIDTEVLPEATHRYEISATLTGTTPEYFIGCDMYNVGSAYGGFFVYTQNTVAVQVTLNRNNVSNVGTWNASDANLLTNKQAYFVIKNGSQKVYLDEEYTTQQSNKTDGTIVWGSSVDTDIPIIPIYLFRVNYTNETNGGSASNYTPTTTKFFWFKIYDDSTNELLHDFRPAKQGEKIGMYDTVTQKFHENIGTGVFSYEEVA